MDDLESVFSATESNAGRATTLVVTAVIGIAFIGFFVGLDYGVPKPDADLALEPTLPTPASGGEVVPAMTYAEVRETRLGPTRQWEYSLEQIDQPTHDLLAEIALTPDDLPETLRTRALNRAYNGAPPVIPHQVDQHTDESCLACHEKGFWIEDRMARRLPHPYLTNCLQCHAPPTPEEFASPAPVANSFVGKGAPLGGERAWEGAPPTIPHTTWMRDNCLACHGPGASPAMLTAHAWRQNCTQCHAPSAELSQFVTTGGARFLPSPDMIDP
jgi:cytochrome c-type protein NapB